MLTVSIPDEIDKQLSSITEDKKKFIIEAVKQKIAKQANTISKKQLAKEYADSAEENDQITKDFINVDNENWNEY
jgi:hypothetical protein